MIEKLICPKGCEIGQIAPFDEKLNIKPYQKYSSEVIKMACLLAIFIPYQAIVDITVSQRGYKNSQASCLAK